MGDRQSVQNRQLLPAGAFCVGGVGRHQRVLGDLRDDRIHRGIHPFDLVEMGRDELACRDLAGADQGCLGGRREKTEALGHTAIIAQ